MLNRSNIPNFRGNDLRHSQLVIMLVLIDAIYQALQCGRVLNISNVEFFQMHFTELIGFFS